MAQRPQNIIFLDFALSKNHYHIELNGWIDE
jgi:hypothetical protein